VANTAPGDETHTARRDRYAIACARRQAHFEKRALSGHVIRRWAHRPKQPARVNALVAPPHRRSFGNIHSPAAISDKRSLRAQKPPFASLRVHDHALSANLDFFIGLHTAQHNRNRLTQQNRACGRNRELLRENRLVQSNCE
jgi:hypothetical protein